MGYIEDFDGEKIAILADIQVTESIEEDVSVIKTSRATRSLKKAIRSITKGFATELSEIDDSIKPKEVEIQFSIGLELEGKFWVIGAKSQNNISVTLKW